MVAGARLKSETGFIKSKRGLINHVLLMVTVAIATLHSFSLTMEMKLGNVTIWLTGRAVAARMIEIILARRDGFFHWWVPGQCNP